jgi:hypothetical protein
MPAGEGQWRLATIRRRLPVVIGRSHWQGLCVQGANTETPMKSLAILIPLGLASALLLATTFRAAAPARVAQAPSRVAPTAVVATTLSVDALRLPSHLDTATLPAQPTRVPASLPTQVPLSLSPATPRRRP